METIREVLMRRDGASEEEALERIAECREAMLEAIADGGDAEEVLADELGLEPDYIFDADLNIWG